MVNLLKSALIVALLIIPHWTVTKAYAQTLTSPNYSIRMGNFNMTSGFKSSASYSLTDTVGQIAADYFSSTGYHVKAGFQYLYTLYDFSFSLSSLHIDLGTLIPGSFSTGSHSLTVTAPGQGYSVAVYATDALKSPTASSIPETTCDAGPCTTTNANVWTSTANYGFGYNVAGNDILSDFINSAYFRPFPNFSLAQDAATIMQSTTAGKNRTATITYKVNVSPTQAAGQYQTQIIYIATPVF